MNKIVMKLISSLLIASMLLSSCGGKKEEEKKQPELLAPVNVVDKTEKATHRDIYNMYQYVASVVPYKKVLSFDSDGSFDKFHVAVGEKVKKGQIIASQSDTSFEIELDGLEKEYKQLQANYQDTIKLNNIQRKLINAKLSKAKKTLKSTPEEQKQEVKYEIDKLEIDKKNIEQSSSLANKDNKAQLNLCKTRIDNLKKKMSNNRIVAPFDGVVSEQSAIAPSAQVYRKQPIATILDNSKSYITCDYNALFNLKEADKLYAIFNGKEYDLEFDGDKEADIVGGSIESLQEANRYKLTDKSVKLDTGTAGIIFFLFDYKENVLSVSVDAIYSEGLNKSYVYRITDGKKEKVYVEIGTKTEIYAEILSGIEEGDVVLDE